MNIVPEAAAMVLEYQAKQRTGTEATRLFQLSIDRFQESMTLSPNSRFAFYETGKMLQEIAIRVNSEVDQLHLLTAAIKYLEQALVIDNYFAQAHLNLADITLDFVIHPHRMKIMSMQNKNPGYIYQAQQMIKDAAAHFQRGLDPDSDTETDTDYKPKKNVTTSTTHSSTSSTLGIVAGSPLSSVQSGGNHTIGYNRKSGGGSRMSDSQLQEVITQAQEIAKRAVDIKLFSLIEASTHSQALREIMVEICKNVDSVHVRNGVFFGWPAMELFASSAINLRYLSLHHVILNDSIFLKLGQHLPHLLSLDLTGCQGINTWPSSITQGLKKLVLDYCMFTNKIYEEMMRVHHGLEHLSLNATNASDEVMGKINEWMRNLSVLSLGSHCNLLGTICYCENLFKPSITIETVINLDFSGCKNLTNTTILVCARSCPNLTSLSLNGCTKIDDQAIMSVAKKCTKLSFLDLTSTSITDNSLKALGKARLPLFTLHLTACKCIKGNNLRFLSGFITLESLYLSYWQLSDPIDPWLALRKYMVTVGNYEVIRPNPNSKKLGNFSSLRRLSVSQWEPLTDASFETILKLSYNLTYIDVSACSRLTDISLERLAETHIGLKHLKMNGCHAISDSGIARLCSQCTNLETLAIEGCTKLTESAFYSIANGCTKLNVLECAHSDGITNQSLQYLLHKCNQLMSIDISHCKLITNDFVYNQLRHQSSTLKIKMEEDKQLRLYNLY